VKSIRSNDDLFRWKETNAPMTTPTVRTVISRLRRTERRMMDTMGPVAPGLTPFNGGAVRETGLTR
jgi:hypothetical protein